MHCAQSVKVKGGLLFGKCACAGYTVELSVILTTDLKFGVYTSYVPVCQSLAVTPQVCAIELDRIEQDGFRLE